MEHEFKVKFLGALGRVTGSCSWIKFDDKQYLVDCGMVQGDNDADIVNNKTFDFNPKDIEAVFLTHAHLDHCGLIPRLYKEGFRGKVWCTTATAKLSKAILNDAVNVMSQKQQYSGIEPLYYEQQVKQLQFKYIDSSDTFKWNKSIPICDDLFITPIRGSHILGSCGYSIGFMNQKTKKSNNIFFSGDIGKNSDTSSEQTFLKGRQTPHPNTQYFVSESTYGGRQSDDLTFNARIKLYQDLIKNQIVEKQGTIIIPTFSMHRTQEILTEVVYAIETLNDDIIEASVKKVIDDINLCLSQLEVSKFSLCESRQILKSIDTFFLENNQYKDFEKTIKECLHISLPLNVLKIDETILNKYNIAYEILDESLMIHGISKDIFKVIDKIKKDGELNRKEHFYFFDHELNNNLRVSVRNLSLIPIELESILAEKVTDIYANELFLETITTKRRKSKWLNDAWTNRYIERKFDENSLKQIFDLKNEEGEAKKQYFKSCKIAPTSQKTRKIIITSSGMCDEGPIKNTLYKYAENENCTIIMNGYTPEGSNGSHLKKINEYSKDEKEIFSLKVTTFDSNGKPIPQEIKLKDVKAKVQQIHGYGGHADKNSLLDFMFYKDPRTNKYNCTPYFFLNHGDSNMREELSKSIVEHAQELLLNPEECNFTDIPQVYTPDHKSGWFNLITEEWEEDEIVAPIQYNDSKNYEILANQQQILKQLEEQKEIQKKIIKYLTGQSEEMVNDLIQYLDE